MKTSHTCTDAENALIERYNGTICSFAFKYFPGDAAYHEREELAQRSRIKFWLATQKSTILHPRVYIALVVKSAFNDMMRTRLPGFPPVLSDEGELLTGCALITQSEGMGDPQEELEREEAFIACMSTMVSLMIQLPPLQRRAVLLRCKKRVHDLAAYVQCLQMHEIDLMREQQLAKANKQSLASSVAPALKKMRAALKKGS